MSHQLGVIGAPTSAAAHFIGQEQGPDHFRRAGLFTELIEAGFDPVDLGDLPTMPFAPDPDSNGLRSVSRVTSVAGQVADRIAAAQSAAPRTLLLGGDCSITVGVVSGLARTHQRVGVAYLDGHFDLNTVESSDYGVLDSMGMSHLFGIYDNELSRIGPRFPLLEPDQALFVGYDPDGVNDGEVENFNILRSAGISLPEAIEHPERISEELKKLEKRVDTIVVHFDVDVLNDLEFPVANFPWYNGLSLEQAGECLSRLLASPKVQCLVLTEFNPDRDKDGRYARQLIEIVGDSLRRSTSSWSAGAGNLVHDTERSFQPGL